MSTVNTKPVSPNAKWWELLIGISMIGFGVYMYTDLTAFEQRGGERKIVWFFSILYDLFGKWGVVIPIFLVAFGIIYAAFSKFRK